ncbi:hypothetical protein [Candidatus Methylomirabilis sp.]|uniref:hypothetical protein n=1 Tax=Candidatus Methylomirabilis sp. TaxID=2032687 RepID=UPI0030764B5E
MTKIKTVLEDGYDIRTVQELLGHNDVHTMMIYIPIPNGSGRVSPARLTGYDRFLANVPKCNSHRKKIKITDGFRYVGSTGVENVIEELS